MNDKQPYRYLHVQIRSRWHSLVQRPDAERGDRYYIQGISVIKNILFIASAAHSVEKIPGSTREFKLFLKEKEEIKKLKTIAETYEQINYHRQ